VIRYSSEFGDDDQPLPDDIADEKRYVAIPSRRELGLGKPLALEFAYKYISDEGAEVEDIFRRRGAYARFKALLERRGQLQEWFAFEEARVTEALRKWCSDNEIEIS
jgi:hypothetical protein